MEKINIQQSELWEEDKSLFLDMLEHYTSSAEKLFFETMCEKMLFENAPCKELLLNPEDNEDGLYLFRIGDEEIEIGNSTNNARFHSMNLAGILNVNLKQIGCIDKDLTLLQWLRKRDYVGIRYDQNFENQD